MQLNKEQLKAIEHEGGPLLIIAGAGTGKTTVITERIKHLISTGRTMPQNILALTFTEKAAKEMQDRVDQAMPYGYTQMWISTFHSFADRLLRAEALHIGLDPNFKLLTQAESVQLLRSNIFDLQLDYFRPVGNPNKFLSGMLTHFSRLQDEAITPEEYLEWVKQEEEKDFTKPAQLLELKKWQELANAYKHFDELKNEKGLMDFGDLIIKSLQLLKSRPNVLERYRDQFQYVLVDEFQDTNIAQYELIKLLAPPGKETNLSIVGDDSQSIYKFRGAAISNILHFQEDYIDCTMVILDKNYRSKQEILDPSYALIQHNNPDTLESRLGITKDLTSLRTPPIGGEVEFIHCDRVENEADAVADKIEILMKENKYSLGDVAILVRANNHADAFIQAFKRHSLPYQFLGPGKLFKQDEVIELISYLRVLYNFEDSISFSRVLTMKHFDIPARDIAVLSSNSRKEFISLFESSEKAQDLQISTEGKEKIGKLMEVIKSHLQLVNKEPPGRILYEFLEATGILKSLSGDAANAEEKRIKNISKFFDKLKTYEVDHPDSRFEEVIDWIELSSELGESPLAVDTDWQKENAINILTVHGSKGLEFPIVFLVNLVAQRFPSSQRSEPIPIPEDLIKEELPQGDFHIQEERRLFYVGMTRAMDKLYLTAADYYGEGKREKKLSPFIFEALGEKADKGPQEAKFLQQSLISYGTSNQEVDNPKEKHLVNYLSHTRIDTFKICPLHYKLRYIFGIPTPPSSAQSFGNSVHTALKKFYELGENRTKDDLLSSLESVWIKDGYKNKKHSDEALFKAKEYLTGYFEQQYEPSSKVVALEESFSIPLLKNGERPLSIGGVMDRVDQLPDGSIEIIDYKTGSSVPTQKEVDKNMQLAVYALAATKIPYAPFAKDPDKVILSLYYFEEQKKLSTCCTAKDLEKLVEDIFQIRTEIEQSDYKCSGHYLCQNDCEYSLFCKSE